MTDPYVHPTAIVDEGATLGEGTKVWHFSHVMAKATIGRDCSLGQNVFVAAGVTIGDRCKIQNNVSLYEGVELEDEVFCGPSMVFTNVKNPRSAFPTDNASYDKTLIKRGATIGANATIVCGATVGEWAFIGAGAVVAADVPPHALVVGVPAKQVGWACECGQALTFAQGRASCACGRVWRERPDGIAKEEVATA